MTVKRMDNVLIVVQNQLRMLESYAEPGHNGSLQSEVLDFHSQFTRTLQSMFGKRLGLTGRARLEAFYTSEPSRRRIELCAA